jgi:Kae1-associated kinase Bud32
MPKERIIAQGAEAIILLKDGKIIKERIQKSYRNQELDEKIRRSRTKKEAKLLVKASRIVNVPRILNSPLNRSNSKEFRLELEYIEGEKLSETLNSYERIKQEEIMVAIGRQVAKLHENEIIHGDLTTSNIIIKEDRIYLIDFGLGFISHRIEDKAVDLHLIKQALEAKHWQNWEELFAFFLKGYIQDYAKANSTIEQLKKVESRGRYKH